MIPDKEKVLKSNTLGIELCSLDYITCGVLPAMEEYGKLLAVDFAKWYMEVDLVGRKTYEELFQLYLNEQTEK